MHCDFGPLFCCAAAGAKASICLQLADSLPSVLFPVLPLCCGNCFSATNYTMANVYTCGYTNGDINRPATCAYPNACQYFAIAPVYNFGCCTPSNTGCYMSACYDYGTPENPNNGSIVLLAGQKFFW